MLKSMSESSEASDNDEEKTVSKSPMTCFVFSLPWFVPYHNTYHCTYIWSFTDYFPDIIKSTSAAVASVALKKKSLDCTDKKRCNKEDTHQERKRWQHTSKMPPKKEVIEIDLDSKEESNDNDDPDLSIPSLNDSKNPWKKALFYAANEKYQKQMRHNINPVSYIGKNKETTLENTVSPRLEGDKKLLK